MTPRRWSAIAKATAPAANTTLPDGSPAWEVRCGTLYVTLAPQVLTAAGTTELAVTLIRGEARITTFTLLIDVHRQPGFATASENYNYVTAFLPQPVNGAQEGQTLQISQVDDFGNVLALEAVDASADGSGGLTTAEKTLLLQLLRNAVYTGDIGSIFTSLEDRWNGAITDNATLSYISAAYAGGQMEEGTKLSAFFSLLTVYAYYSDGSSRLLTADEYTLSGSTIVQGSNTITVHYGGMSTIFTVTGYVPSYTVTYALSNVVSGSSVASVSSGSYYSTTLTAIDGYSLSVVSITMGSTNITATAYADGTVSIDSVSGNIVITAVAEKDAEPEVTLSSISADYTGGPVEAGVTVLALKGLIVTAYYSDGTSKTVTDYVLSGTISEGINTILVSYNGKTTTFTVTGTAPSVTSYTVKNTMTNAKTNNTINIVTEGSAYSATITANEGYTLSSVTVTMGGTDITATAWNSSTGMITIQSVTGNIVITAIATEGADILLSSLVTFAPGSAYIDASTKQYVNLGVTAELNRLSANIEEVSFRAGDTLTIGDYSTYKYALSTTPVSGVTAWVGGGYQTADYTLTAEQAADMRIIMVARNDNAVFSDADIAYIEANAKVVRA